jgi:hypothetical protein
MWAVDMWAVDMAERAARGDAVCLSSVISGKRFCSLRDQISASSARTSNTPPVASGVSVTEPISSAKVVSNSCAIQEERRPQPHSRQ